MIPFLHFPKFEEHFKSCTHKLQTYLRPHIFFDIYLSIFKGQVFIDDAHLYCRNTFSGLDSLIYICSHKVIQILKRFHVQVEI